MHCLSDGFHAAEGEGQVGKTSTYSGSRQGFLAKILKCEKTSLFCQSNNPIPQALYIRG